MRKKWGGPHQADGRAHVSRFLLLGADDRGDDLYEEKKQVGFDVFDVSGIHGNEQRRQQQGWQHGNEQIADAHWFYFGVPSGSGVDLRIIHAAQLYNA